MSELVEVSVHDAIATVTLCNPGKMGALSVAAMQQLNAAMTEIGKRQDIHVVVLASQGKVFSAGHDLSEVRGADETQQRQIFETCTELMLTLQRIAQPVIAKVHGLATAAGCQLVATCDLAVASQSARFATPGVRIGLFCSTPMVALSRAVPQKVAMRMLLTGDPITADEAAAAGLVSDVVPDDELDEAVSTLATRVAHASAATVSLGKRAFYDQLNLPVAEAYEKMSEVMTRNAVMPDAQEGIGAFLEKRDPVWQHHDQ
ncbi:enoyl-CoA hydratase [Enteractinococcus fodinae]|uniref:Enoyl-CoA hydratase domain-containing protein 3, mitochondrial n=1 Tax=Enteractinococcus fodinae TaxID=684663 RepID=A0ABU2AYP3_9MICC|nr:enoyl-CoA hydratase [Enteractinococcus fodinae]MDR7346286.1 enoyl-CoA hydratase/carnithine racemase [Enteractinococcus fodinae]